MNNLSSERSKEIMLSMFPNKQQTEKQRQPLYQPTKVHPMLQTQHNRQHYNSMNKDIKKWYVAAMISLFAIFVLSSFSLNFIDDLCARKNIEAFTDKGDPKIHLIIVLFLFIFVFSRVAMMLI
jgi:hypothetical protein